MRMREYVNTENWPILQNRTTMELQTLGMRPGADRLVGLEPFAQVGIIIGGLEFFVHNHKALQYLFGQIVLKFRG